AAGGGGRGGGNQTGKREVAWRTDGLGLSYVEQEPGPATPAGGRNGRAGAGNTAPTNTTTTSDGTAPQTPSGRGAQVPIRNDRVYQWLPPFDAPSAKVIYENPTRISGHRYSPDMQILFFSERAGQNALE